MSSFKESFFESFSSALYYVLKNRGLQQRYIADSLNVSESQVSKWINGINTPNARTRKKISDLLSVNFSLHNSGKWQIIELAQNKHLEQLDKAVNEMADQYAVELASQANTDADLDLLVSYALKESEALQASLKALKQVLEKRLNKRT